VAGAVRLVLEDSALRQRLQEKALERSRAFSWESCARQTLETLEEVARA
jgi:glycosyltransferase involved in cell wall biosynthesis